MANERIKHQEIVTQLKEEIFRLEEFSESQQEQALKIEEEKSQISDQLKKLKYELESERKSHEVEVNILSCKIENTERDVTKLESDLKVLNEEQRLLQQNYESKLSSAEKNAELKIFALQSEIQSISSNISEQSVLQSELLQIKKQLEREKQKSSHALAKLEIKHLQETEAIKTKHNTLVEKLHEELSAFEEREKNLKQKLDSSSSELEVIASQLQSLHKKETAFKKQISAFQGSEAKYRTEVSQLKSDVTKLQGEISHMKSAAVAYKNKISSLKAELQRDSELDVLLQSSSRRSSSTSESSRYDEIITKMRIQLEELQKVLESKSGSNEHDGERHPAAELINKLITNSSALNAEVLRMRQGISAERLSHLQVCSQKDEILHKLQAEKEKQSSLIKRLAVDISEDISSQMSTLQTNCGQSIFGCRVKLDEALLKLASIGKALKDRDHRHASALDTLFSDLDHSHNEISNYKEEINRLQLELEVSHQSLDESQDQLTRLHSDKEAETDDLKLQLEQALKQTKSPDSVPSDIVSSRNVKVDADSGQVIAEHEDSQTRDEVLLQKEETIHKLKDEIEQLKLSERHMKLMNEEANRKVAEKEWDVKQTQQAVNSLQRKSKELETKLDQQEHEVTTVTFYSLQSTRLHAPSSLIYTPWLHTVLQLQVWF